MGLILRFFAHPYPLGRGADVANDRLPTLGDMDVLNGHLLFALRAIFLQRRHLRCEGACELVEGIRGAILLRDILDVRQAAGECQLGRIPYCASPERLAIFDLALR